MNTKMKGSAAVFVGGACFGILSTIVKKAYGLGYNLGQITGSQALLGALILWLLFFLTRQKKRRQNIVHTSPAWVLMLCGLSTGSVSILYYKCIELVPASIAIILLMQYIWIGTLLEYLFFRKKPSLYQLVGCVFVLLGTGLSTGIFEQDISSFPLSGLMYGLLAATAYASFILLNGRVGTDYTPLHKSALMITGSLTLVLVILQPVSLLNRETIIPLLPYAIVLTLFGAIIPPLVFAYGMPKTGYALGSILSAVELPISVLLSYVILKEKVSGLQWLGVVVILTVICVIQLTKKEPHVITA